MYNNVFFLFSFFCRFCVATVSFFVFLVASFDGLRPLLVTCHCSLCSLANKLRSFVRVDVRVHLLIYICIYYISAFMHSSICVCMYTFIYLRIYLCIYVFIFLFVYLFIHSFSHPIPQIIISLQLINYSFLV